MYAVEQSYQRAIIEECNSINLDIETFIQLNDGELNDDND
jgi:hypothetical protein